jgi:hypothetical protein
LILGLEGGGPGVASGRCTMFDNLFALAGPVGTSFFLVCVLGFAVGFHVLSGMVASDASRRRV